MARSQTSKFTLLASISDLSVQEIGAESVLHVLRASPAPEMYAEKSFRLRELFYTFFHAGQSAMALINGCQFLQTVLNSEHRGAVATLDITTPSIFKNRMIFSVKR